MNEWMDRWMDGWMDGLGLQGVGAGRVADFPSSRFQMSPWGPAMNRQCDFQLRVAEAPHHTHGGGCFRRVRRDLGLGGGGKGKNNKIPQVRGPPTLRL